MRGRRLIGLCRRETNDGADRCRDPRGTRARELVATRRDQQFSNLREAAAPSPTNTTPHTPHRDNRAPWCCANRVPQKFAVRIKIKVDGRIAWLDSRVVSVLDSGAEGPRFKSQSRPCRVTVLGKLFTPSVPLFTKRRNW